MASVCGASSSSVLALFISFDATTKRFANNNILQQQQQNHIVCAQTASTDRDTQGIENESIMRSTRL